MTAKQEIVLDVLAKVSKRERSTIIPEQELTADLGIDSPKGLQVLMELEEALKIEISDDDAPRFNKVSDILDYVARLA